MPPNYIALAIPIFFVFIGIEAWVARRRGLSVLRLPDALTDVSCGTLQTMSLVFVSVLILAGYAGIYEHHRLFDLSAKSAGVWLLGFLGVDVLYYFWHRLSHLVNIMWAGHVVHHSSEDYNLAVALRQSVLTAFTAAPFTATLAWLGIPPPVYAAIHSFNLLYQFWIHTQLIGNLGWFETIFNTPSHHRVHHGINPRYLDKNYGGTLIIWDRLFGTFEPETEPPVYGIVRPLSSFNPLWAQIHYGVELARLTVKAPAWADKVRVWWKGPTWYPAGLPPPPGPAPVSPSTFEKYDPPVSVGLGRYLLVQYAVVMAFATVAVLLAPRLPMALVLGATALTVISLISTGGLIEGKGWARPLEGARLALLMGAAVFVVRS
jgi:sterol desaturase/sphingolipid hydroxylase (fatty acid hydroxylase superfamily)